MATKPAFHFSPKTVQCRENLVHPLINEPHWNFQSSICLPDKHHVEFSLSARWQTPLSSALRGIITNSWGGRLFSNPKGSRDVPTVCYYLLCSQREPRASVPDHPLTITESLFATHRPSQLPYRTVTHVCYLKATMVMEDMRLAGLIAALNLCCWNSIMAFKKVPGNYLLQAILIFPVGVKHCN